MKTTLLTLLLILTFSYADAQCIENAFNFGNNNSIPRYNISGDVNVTLNTNNTISVNFGSNFSTASGPDVRVYLIDSENKSSADLKSISRNSGGNLVFNNGSVVDNLSFGLIGFSGAQNYNAAIPEGKNISDYDTVYFFCLQFNQFWDYGSFTPFTNNSCAVLSTESETLNKTTIYPNPAQNQIQISNIDEGATELLIFNILGKQVLHLPKVTQKTIDVSSLNAGIYMVRLLVDGKSKTQRLVIR